MGYPTNKNDIIHPELTLDEIIAGKGNGDGGNGGGAAAAAAGADRAHERETPADDNWQKQNVPVEDSEEDLEDDYDR